MIWGLGTPSPAARPKPGSPTRSASCAPGTPICAARRSARLARWIGTFLSVGLASIRLNLPIVLGGGTIIVLAIFLLLVMPEHGFQPAPRQERGSWRAMGQTFRSGVQAVRGRPLLITILGIGAFFGASSEAFDRLWQAHSSRTSASPSWARSSR